MRAFVDSNAYVAPFVFLALLVILSLFLAGIVMLVRTIPCVRAPGNSYEHFETTPVSPVQSRIDTIQTIRDTIQSDLDSLHDSQDDTCEILKQIEQSQVANYSLPNDTAEYSNPDPKRADSRNARAKKRFELEKQQYTILHSTGPLLECFDDASDERMLSGEVDALSDLLDKLDMKLADTITTTLGFNSGYLQKMVKASTTEGFFTDLRGPELLAKADAVIDRANTLHTKLQSVRSEVEKQTKVARALNTKHADLQNGKVSQDDIQNVQEKTNVTKSPNLSE